MLYYRWQQEILKKALDTHRVVVLNGVSESGKQTLARAVLKNRVSVRSLDDKKMLEVALDDPVGFLSHKRKTLVVTELQNAISLLPEIKRVVDNDNTPGQFILTYSADVQSFSTVQESLAGRVNIRLHTLTEGEVRRCKPQFIQKALCLQFEEQYKNCSKEVILNIAFRGGYPEVVRLKKRDRKKWYFDYYQKLLNKDLKVISNLRMTEKLRIILQILASYSSKYIDLNGICALCHISRPTLYSYIGYIEKLNLCERLRPWVKYDYDRIGRKDKFYMTDTGLMAVIVGWYIDDVMFDKDKYEPIIKTLVYHELSAQIDLVPNYSMYHYRDRENREIDFIIEDDENHILAIEVKGGSHVAKDDFKHMTWFEKNLLKKDQKFIGIILYSGQNTLSFGKNLRAVPIASLWE